MPDSVPFQVVLLNSGNGGGARPMALDGVRGMLAQCRQPGVPTVPFIKQLRVVSGRVADAGPVPRPSGGCGATTACGCGHVPLGGSPGRRRRARAISSRSGAESASAVRNPAMSAG